jgi:acyl-CoA thioesterase-1
MRSTSSTPSPSTDAGPPAGRRRLLLALGAAPLAACGRKAPRYTAIPAGSTVLALGDSLTFGSGAVAGAAYPARLAELTGWHVVNAGVPGDTSAQARERLRPLLAEHAPKAVLLSIGGNDFLRQVPEAQTRTNVAAMLDEIHAAGAQPVLIAVPRPAVMAALLRSLDDHPLYEALAEQRRVPLFAAGWAEVLSDPALKADQIHANAAGYERFARRLHGFLNDAGIAPR